MTNSQSDETSSLDVVEILKPSKEVPSVGFTLW